MPRALRILTAWNLLCPLLLPFGEGWPLGE
jgi:hypothetical protein